MLPKSKTTKNAEHSVSAGRGYAKPKQKKKKPRKSMFSRFVDEAWDTIEDIFD